VLCKFVHFYRDYRPWWPCGAYGCIALYGCIAAIMNGLGHSTTRFSARFSRRFSQHAHMRGGCAFGWRVFVLRFNQLGNYLCKVFATTAVKQIQIGTFPFSTGKTTTKYPGKHWSKTPGLKVQPTIISHVAGFERLFVSPKINGSTSNFQPVENKN